MSRTRSDGASAWEADVGLPQLFERARRYLSAGVCLITVLLRPPSGRIQVTGVSAEWLERHAAESAKHDED